jgi:hypothetical protein
MEMDRYGRERVIRLKTAKALGIAIPKDVLLRANESERSGCLAAARR